MIICLDPGHGGRDPGAVKHPLIEKTLNLQLMMVIHDILKDAGHTVITTRTSDRYVYNQKRAATANDGDADIFISLHHNAFRSPKANGFEVLHYPRSVRGWQVANRLCEKVCAAWPIRNRGPKPRGNLTVLKRTKMPAILIEAGFVTSTVDRRETLLHADKRSIFYHMISKKLLEVLDEVF